MEDVIKKLRFKNAAVIINPPEDLQKAFVKFSFTFLFDKKEKSTNSLIFVNDSKELFMFLKKGLKNI